jgi:two-component system, sensor histidine kinase and response regulator
MDFVKCFPTFSIILYENPTEGAMDGLIFAVDDNPTNLQIIRVILKNAGHRVETFSTGETFTEALKERVPDLILMDIIMPDINGFDLCARVKQLPGLKEIPILFISALDDHENRVKGLQTGAVDYISKPFNKDELLARVHTHLELLHLTRQLQAKIDENESLVRIMSHDLSNYLQVNLSIIELLFFTGMTDGKLTRFLETMHDMSIKMKELIDNIRNLIAIESGKRNIELQPVSLVEAIGNAGLVFQEKLRAKRLSLLVEPDPIPPDCSVMAEPITFQNTVINNLISNAIKFSYPENAIIIKLRRVGSLYEIRVIDHGAGMPPEVLTSLFDSRKKTSMRGTSGEEGTGFGMPLVKRFVERCGGTINVESKYFEVDREQHGTVVVLTLHAGISPEKQTERT